MWTAHIPHVNRLYPLKVGFLSVFGSSNDPSQVVCYASSEYRLLFTICTSPIERIINNRVACNVDRSNVSLHAAQMIQVCLWPSTILKLPGMRSTSTVPINLMTCRPAPRHSSAVRLCSCRVAIRAFFGAFCFSSSSSMRWQRVSAVACATRSSHRERTPCTNAHPLWNRHA